MSDPSDQYDANSSPEVDSDNPDLSDGTASDDGTVGGGGSGGQDEGNEADSDSVEDAPTSTPENRKQAAEGDAGNSAKKANATPPAPPPIMEIRNCTLSAPAGSTVGGIIIANCPISYCTISGAKISNCSVNNSTVSGDQVSNCTLNYSTLNGCQVSGCNNYNYSTLNGVIGGLFNSSRLKTTNFGTSSLFMINGHSFRGSTGNFHGFEYATMRTGLVTIPSNEPWNVQIQRNTIGNDLQVVLGSTTVTITPRAGTSPNDFAVNRNYLGQMVIDWESPGRHARSATDTQINNPSYSLCKGGTGGTDGVAGTGGSAVCCVNVNGHSIRVRPAGSTGASIKCINERVAIPCSEPLDTPLQITINGNILTAVLGGVTVTVTPRAGTSPNDLVVYRNDRGEIEVELPYCNPVIPPCYDYMMLMMNSKMFN